MSIEVEEPHGQQDEHLSADLNVLSCEQQYSFVEGIFPDHMLVEEQDYNLHLVTQDSACRGVREREFIDKMPRARPLPPNPPNEAERLMAVHEIVPELGLGDGAPEDPMLDMLCKTICKLFKVPIAGEARCQD